MSARFNLTRKDYELIAATIAESEAIPDSARSAVALDFADRLCVTTDSFDPVRFVNSCLEDPMTAESVAAWTHSLKLRVEAIAARRRP